MFEDAIEEIATNDPPPAPAISRAVCLSTSIVPVTFSSTVSRHLAVSIWVSGPIVVLPPADATTARSGPSPAACATAASTCASSVTSVTAYATRTPAAATRSISVTAPRSRSRLRPAITTCAPSAANRSAQPSPIPLPPPVTSATESFSGRSARVT